MIGKDYCMSSFLVFRYIINDDKEFYEHTNHRIYHLIPIEKRVLVWNEDDIDRALEEQISRVRER